MSGLSGSDSQSFLVLSQIITEHDRVKWENARVKWENADIIAENKQFSKSKY